MMLTNPKISILLSTYNNESSIVDSVKSILNQSYQDFELLIMDDGSSDRTLKLCKNLEEKDHRVVVYTNKSNLGLTKSLNLLASEAKGNYLARQDGDDISLKNRLYLQMQTLEKHNLDIVCSRAYVKDSKKITPKYKNLISYKIVYKYSNPFIHGTFFLKKSVFYDLGGYDENFFYSQDYKFMYDAIKKKAKIKIIKKPLYVLNTKDNISTNEYEKQKFFADHVKNETLPNSIF